MLSVLLTLELLSEVSVVCKLESVRGEVSDELANAEVEDTSEPVL